MIVPALLGLSIGAMAIVLAFPTNKMFAVLSEGGREDSYYMGLAAKFVHFIALQTITLAFAISAPMSLGIIIDIIGFWLLSYALLSGALVAAALYNVARLYNHPGAND